MYAYRYTYFLDICINTVPMLLCLSLSLISLFKIRFVMCFIVAWKMHQKRKIVFFIWPSNALCPHRIATGEDLPLLFKEYDKTFITFKEPAVSHIVWKERRWICYFQNALIQFFLNELQKLHPRITGEHSSVLEVFSLGQYPTVKLWGMYLERILVLGATVHPWIVWGYTFLLNSCKSSK